MLKIRRPLGRLIFNMGIAIPGKTVFLIETAPWVNTGSGNGLLSDSTKPLPQPILTYWTFRNKLQWDFNQNSNCTEENTFENVSNIEAILSLPKWSEYRKSQYGHKTILWWSYFNKGISCSVKMTSSYWIKILVPWWQWLQFISTVALGCSVFMSIWALADWTASLAPCCTPRTDGAVHSQCMEGTKNSPKTSHSLPARARYGCLLWVWTFNKITTFLEIFAVALYHAIFHRNILRVVLCFVSGHNLSVLLDLMSFWLFTHSMTMDGLNQDQKILCLPQALLSFISATGTGCNSLPLRLLVVLYSWVAGPWQTGLPA